MRSCTTSRGRSRAAVAQLVRPTVQLLNVHALGGLEMMRAAVDAAAERAAELGIAAPHVFAVTLLTSIAPEDLNELGLQGGPGENAIRLAALARDAGCAGVVCSAHEVRDLKRFFGDDFLTLTPGIRPAGSAHARSEARHDAGTGRRRRLRLHRRRAPDRRGRRSRRGRQSDLGGDERTRVSAPQLDLRTELTRARRAAGRAFPS